MIGRRRKAGREQGFSLLEILVALAIIAVIGTLVAPRLFNQLDRSKLTTARAQVRSIKTALDTLRLDLGRYPSAQEGLTLLVTPPAESSAAAQWAGPYLDGELPADPWGNPYRYEPPGETGGGAFADTPDIYTLGADNAPGGTGMNIDIHSRTTMGANPPSDTP